MIIEQLNQTHLLTITIMPVLAFLLMFFSLRKQNEKTQTTVLLIICIINAVFYAVYKVAQAYDPDYNFNLFTNLPLHFCNINLILLPLAIATKNKNLLAYQLYFGTGLAFVALLTVDPAFRSKSIFAFTCFFYFYYHSMLMVIPYLLLALKRYRPSFRYILQPILLLVSLTFIMHLVNIVFRSTGLAADANYFYTFGMDGDSFNESLRRLIPYNLLYLLPTLIFFIPQILIVTFPYYLIDRRKHREKLGK